MQQLTISAQTVLFVYSLLLGGAVGVLYDFFRIMRRAFRHGWLAIALEDGVFFISCVVAIFIFNMRYCGGSFRLFVLLGMLLGWLLYFFTIGVAVIRASQLIINFVRRLWLATTVPLLKLLRFFKKVFLKAIKPLIMKKNRLKKHGSVLYNKYICTHRKDKQVRGKSRWRNTRQKKKRINPPSTGL